MKKYYPTINLLRGLAAFAVCLFHFICSNYRGPLFDPSSTLVHIAQYGSEGVYAFFVISGFVIPLSLHKYNYQLKRFHKFCAKRFIRIETPYFASIFLILGVNAFFAWRGGSSLNFEPERMMYHIAYLIPFTKYDWYNIIYWTLAIEFQFYLLIGLIYPLFVSKKRGIQAFILILFIGFNFIGIDHRFVFNYGTIFLIGISLFLIHAQYLPKKIGFVIVFICIIATGYLHSISIAIVCTATVFAIHFVEIDTKLTNLFGDISYSFYLTHGLIGGNLIYFMLPKAKTLPNQLMLLSISVLACLIFAYLFWRFIEAPSQKLSRKVKMGK